MSGGEPEAEDARPGEETVTARWRGEAREAELGLVNFREGDDERRGEVTVTSPRVGGLGGESITVAEP